VIGIRPANVLSRRDECHSQNDRLDPGRRCRLRNARSADISASFRYGEHALAFVLVGFAFGLAYGRNRWATAAISVALIGLLEILQLWMPGRHARLGDFVVDAMAACAGLALAARLDWAIRRARRPNVGTS
jgi:VanZ family protein